MKLKFMRMTYFNLVLGIFMISFLFSASIALGEENETQSELSEKGKDLLRSEQYEEALSYIEEVLEKDPTNLDALKTKSSILFRIGEFEEASSTLDKVLELNPNDIESLNLKMIILGNLGESHEAGTYFLRISELNQKIQAFVLKGQLHYQRAEFEDALSSFNDALEINPEQSDALNGKALTFLKLEKFFDALTQMRKAELAAPGHPVIIRNILQMMLSIPYDPYPDGSLKLQLRDSNGGLVGYQEVIGFGIFDLNTTDKFLDSWEVKDVISPEGQNFEVSELKVLINVDDEKPYTQTWVTTPINKTDVPRMFGLHHGIPTQEGDVVYELWTIARPID